MIRNIKCFWVQDWQHDVNDKAPWPLKWDHMFKFHTYYHLKVIQFYTLNYNIAFSFFTWFYSDSQNSNTLVAHVHSIFQAQTSLKVTKLPIEMHVAASPTSSEGHAFLTICLSVQEYRVHLEVSEVRIYWPCQSWKNRGQRVMYFVVYLFVYLYFFELRIYVEMRIIFTDFKNHTNKQFM